MDLLNWMLGVADRVKRWFGNEYNALYNGAKHAWDWAVDLANQAYQNAANFATQHLNYAISLFNNLVGYVNGWFGNLQNAINQVYGTIYNWVDDRIGGIYNSVISVLNGALQSVVDWVSKIPGEIQNWVNGQINWVQRWVSDNFGWVFQIQGALQQVLDFISGGLIDYIYYLINTVMPQFVAFFDDPIAFLYGLFAPTILEYLSFLLGYALGTTKYELPRTPLWRK